jgi:hypothetical protein
LKIKKVKELGEIEVVDISVTNGTYMSGNILNHNCKYCWSLWTRGDDKVTPRVYKLSELSANPGNPKNPDPSVSPTHISCRDILTILMPGFGFDDAGKITYIGNGHDEYAKQRGK